MLARSRQSARDGDYATALRTLMTALEQFPDDQWTAAEYERAADRVHDWFARLPKDQRQALIAEYEAPRAPIAEVLGAMLQPSAATPEKSTSSIPLKTPSGRLAFAVWKFLEGDYAQFAAYLVTTLEQAPDSLATRNAIMALMAIQYYRGDKNGGIQTVRVAARLAPNNHATGWAVCRVSIFLCGRRQAALAKELCSNIQAAAPETVAGKVAAQMLAMIADIESTAYDAAFERLWALRDYAIPGPAREMLDMFMMGIDGRTAQSDTTAQERMGRLMKAAEKLADQDADPLRRAGARLALAHCWQRQGKRMRSAEIFQQVADSGQPGAREYALTQVGVDLFTVNPKRAIAALEEYRAGYGRTAGAVASLKLLGMLYRKVGRHADGLKLIEEIEDQCRTGESFMEVRDETLTANKVGCLRGLGRHAEADVLAEPILRKYGYGTAMSAMSTGQLAQLFSLLTEMGQDDLAAPYMQEINLRAKR